MKEKIKIPRGLAKNTLALLTELEKSKTVPAKFKLKILEASTELRIHMRMASNGNLQLPERLLTKVVFLLPWCIKLEQEIKQIFSAIGIGNKN